MDKRLATSRENLFGKPLSKRSSSFQLLKDDPTQSNRIEHSPSFRKEKGDYESISSPKPLSKNASSRDLSQLASDSKGSAPSFGRRSIPSDLVLSNSRLEEIKNTIGLHRSDSTPKFVWKRDQSAEAFFISKMAQKSLPITNGYQRKLKSLSLESLKITLDSMQAKLESSPNNGAELSHMVFDYTTSCVATLAKIDNSTFDEITDKGNLTENLHEWAKTQLYMMSVLTQREADIKELLKAVEKIEEENLLLKEVAAQKLPFSSDNTIEINVNQIVQFPGVIKELMLEKETDTLDLLPPVTDKPSSEPILKFVEVIRAPSKPEVTDFSVQTDPVKIEDPLKASAENAAPIQRKVIDMMDKMVGTENPIIRYATIGLMADFPHPAEVKYEELWKVYQMLVSEHQDARMISDQELAALRNMYEVKISTITTSFNDRITELETLKTVLEQTNEKNEQKLRTTEFDLEDIKGKYTESVSQVEYFMSETEGLRKSDRAMRQEIHDLKGNVETLGVTIKKYDEKVVVLEEKGQTLEKTLHKTESELQSCTQQLHVAETQREENFNNFKKFEALAEEQTSTMKNMNERMSFLEVVNTQMEREAKQAFVERDKVLMTNEELERMIDQLMKFPDIEEGPEFDLKGLPANQETYELMNEMLDATKLRIMLLEKRNKQYRALQMKQVYNEGSEKWALYNPINERLNLFDRLAVDSSRPASAAHSTTDSTVTYIIGSSATSRAVSASSVRFLEPKKAPFRAGGLAKDGIAPTKQRPRSSVSRPNSAKTINEYGMELDESFYRVYSDTHHPPPELGGYLHEDDISERDQDDGFSQSEFLKTAIKVQQSPRPSSVRSVRFSISN